MNKNDILDAIKINAEIIARHKADVKKLEKARALLVEVGMNPEQVDRGIADLKESIASVEARQVTRKKQLKLVEKLEALITE